MERPRTAQMVTKIRTRQRDVKLLAELFTLTIFSLVLFGLLIVAVLVPPES